LEKVEPKAKRLESKATGKQSDWKAKRLESEATGKPPRSLGRIAFPHEVMANEFHNGFGSTFLKGG